MRYIYAFSLALLLAAPAGAVDLVCAVPAAAVPRAVEICETLRLQKRIRAADWSNDVCATELLRIGLVTTERKIATDTARRTTRTIVNDAVVAYQANHPTALTAAECGDGTTDAEYGETCDDGNRTNGDGCSDVCQTE